MSETAEVLARSVSDRGELVLRRSGTHYEIISNGVFLMDTRDGRSERLLADAALRRHPTPGTVLIGGLGVGFSLVAALADSRVESVVVVEIEPVLVSWHETYLGEHSERALGDPRVRLVVADVRDHLAAHAATYDVICLDVDNGPGWTVTESNAALYDGTGMDLLCAALRPGGVLAVWSAHAAPDYETQLARHLDDIEALSVGVERGEPDVVFLGRRPVGPDV